MFGVPDPEPGCEPGVEEVRPSRLQALFSRAEDDDSLPISTDPSVLFLLDERISPRPLRLRDRPLQLAMVVSLLLHFMILSQLPTGSLLQTILGKYAAIAHKKPTNDNTPFFELVEMPRHPAEKPLRDHVAASDLDRRAHGGHGAPSDRPGSKGNTPELRLEPPGNHGIAQPAPGTEPQVAEATKPSSAAPQSTGQESPPERVAENGDSALLAVPPGRGGGRPSRPGLQGLSTYGMPGSPGGAVPDRKGGQVDMGDLSFDTDWYEWGPYAAEMLSRIRYHWRIPELAYIGVRGVVHVRFYIERDGRVTGVEVIGSSAHPPFDFAARDAVIEASPLPPLPDDLVGVNHEGVTIGFYYNTPLPNR
jgi:TonB family protein